MDKPSVFVNVCKISLPKEVVRFCGTQNRAVFWPFGKRGMELLILDKKEKVAESQ